ncbi:MAG: uroporphyrinogen-III synthase [Armatimonadaceae bacterium]
MKHYCVVNTRARHQQSALTTLCESRGWSVLSYPCLGVTHRNTHALHDRLTEGTSGYAWLVLTSSNAVASVATAVSGQNISLPRLACVGMATAEAAASMLGQRVEFIPNEATGHALATHLPLCAGDRILLPQSAIANTDTATVLRSRGADVDCIDAYEVAHDDSGDDVPAAVRAGAIDAVMVTSPSSLDGFLRRMDAANVERTLVDQLVFAPIGPTTSLAISKNSLQALPVPTEHSLEGLIDVLVCYFDGLDTPNETVQT